MKKRTLQKGLAFLFSMLVMFSSVGISAQATESTEAEFSASDIAISPRADKIETYYREYNGKLQVRHWNATRGYWIDNWTTISQ